MSDNLAVDLNADVPGTMPGCDCPTCCRKREQYAAMLRGPQVVRFNEDDSTPDEKPEVVETLASPFRSPGPRSQKAKGVSALRDWMQGYAWSLGPITVPNFKLIEDITPDELRRVSFPVFARPCPTRPRHGFVDSRRVDTREELVELVRETLRADPFGEVLLMQRIAAKCSAVWCPEQGTLALGPSNDGATRGYGVYTLNTEPTTLDERLKEKANIQQAPYMELVYGRYAGTYVEKDVPYAVQLRDGPELKGAARDFIPTRVTVLRTVKPNLDDLLAWEAECQRLKGEPGVVVVAPGASLSCHAAIHCVVNGVPFVTTREVAMGDVLEPVSAEAPEFWNRGDARAGFLWTWEKLLPLSGDQVPPHEKQGGRDDLFALATAVLHNWSALRTSPEALRLVSIAASTYALLGAASVWGEMRYYKGKKHPMCNGNANRWTVYRPLFKMPFKFLRNLHYCVKKYYETWNWDSGCGGPKWGLCAYETLRLVRALSQITEGRSEKVCRAKLDRLVEQLNRMVNLAHNGGWWLNKLVGRGGSMMDRAAQKPGWFLVENGLMLFEALEGCVRYNRAEWPHLLPPKAIKRPRLSKVRAAQIRPLTESGSPDSYKVQARLINGEEGERLREPSSDGPFVEFVLNCKDTAWKDMIVGRDDNNKSWAQTDKMYAPLTHGDAGWYLGDILMVTEEEIYANT